jgi:hypothetical protein
MDDALDFGSATKTSRHADDAPRNDTVTECMALSRTVPRAEYAPPSGGDAPCLLLNAHL